MKKIQNKVSPIFSRLMPQSRARQVSTLAIAVTLAFAGTAMPIWKTVVEADQYANQVTNLEAANAQSRNAINGLQSQAASYNAIIANLQNQINAVQAAITANQAEQASLQQQIADAQAEIDKQRAVLSDSIKTMYVDGTPDTLEMLATSKNLSEFVDKQEYRSRVQNKIQDTMAKIAELQKQLTEKSVKVQQLIEEQKTQQAQLDGDRAKQQELLNANESQQASFVAQIQANNAELAKIQAARAAALARISGSGGRSTVGSPIQYKNFVTNYSMCGGGYSYCWAGYDQIVSDPWGLNYAHECVHYVADWLARNGHNVPRFGGGGGGNANQWYRYAPEVRNPQRGDVVYMPIAPVGHVGIVEYVNGDGTVHVSQMNWPVGGYYSEMDLYITSGIQFFRF